MPKLTGWHFMAVLVTGILGLTIICCVGMYTGHNGTLQMGVIGGIGAALGLAAGVVIPGNK